MHICLKPHIRGVFCLWDDDCVIFSMKRPWLILPVISLLVAQQNDANKPTNLEIDQIKYKTLQIL